MVFLKQKSIDYTPELRSVVYAVSLFLEKRLGERNSSVFISRCFRGETYVKIAGRFNLSAAYVSQIVQRCSRCLYRFSYQNSDGYCLPMTPKQVTYLNVPVKELDISVRLHNLLKNAKCRTIYDILRYTSDDFLGQRNFGRKSLYELQDRLQKMGFTLGERYAVR